MMKQEQTLLMLEDVVVAINTRADISILKFTWATTTYSERSLYSASRFIYWNRFIMSEKRAGIGLILQKWHIEHIKPPRIYCCYKQAILRFENQRNFPPKCLFKLLWNQANQKENNRRRKGKKARKKRKKKERRRGQIELSNASPEGSSGRDSSILFSTGAQHRVMKGIGPSMVNQKPEGLMLRFISFGHPQAWFTTKPAELM